MFSYKFAEGFPPSFSTYEVPGIMLLVGATAAIGLEADFTHLESL